VYGRLEPAALKHRSTARPHFSYIRDPKLANGTLARHGPTVKKRNFQLNAIGLQITRKY
jgi:hypothetical protein